jgi:hypothetical protein
LSLNLLVGQVQYVSIPSKAPPIETEEVQCDG